MSDPRSRAAVEAAAQYAQGLASEQQLGAAADAAKIAHAEAFQLRGKVGACAEWTAQFAASPNAWFAATRTSNFAYVAAGDELESGPEHAAQAHVLRCVFGPLPFRPVSVDFSCLTPAVIRIAQSMYDRHTFDRMVELADDLEQAGCADKDILAHCRESGPHVRGCWVVDLILMRD